MSLAFWMIQRLTREIIEDQRLLAEKTRALTNMQKYASRLGGSSVLNLSNIAGLSAEILPRASLFAQYSDQASSMSAMQSLQAMKMMGRVPVTGNPMAQMQIEQSAFMQFKQEALKQLKQQEVNVMNEQEKQIQLELNSIEQRLKVKEKQLESYKGLYDKTLERQVPKFS